LNVIHTVYIIYICLEIEQFRYQLLKYTEVSRPYLSMKELRMMTMVRLVFLTFLYEIPLFSCGTAG